MADWDVVGSTPVPPPAKLDPLTQRVKQQESRGNMNAVGPMTHTGERAEGSMQTLPSTLADPGYGVRPAQNNTPAEKERVGVDYLAAMKKKYGNDDYALAAYNWGPDHVNNLISKGIKPGTPEFTAAIPPETRKYISNIKGGDWSVAKVEDPKAWAPVSQTPATPEGVVAAKAPDDGLTVTHGAQPADLGTTAAPEQGGKEWLASVFEPSQKAGANLISGAMAPFMSEKSLKILQDKGLYTPGESPLKEFSTAAYGTMMAPVAPAIQAAAGKAKDAGNATIGKDSTNMVGDMLNTAMDVAGFALPGIKGAEAGFTKPSMFNAKGEAITPAFIEKKLTDLEVKHDATKDPVKQAAIKQQMLDLVNSGPEAENMARDNGTYKAPPTKEELKAQQRAASSGWNVINPEGAGPKADDTATTIRAETGTAGRNTAKTEAELVRSYNKAAEMSPEQQSDFYQYVEGRSKGATLQDPGLQKMADDTKNVMENTRKEIESLPKGDEIGFYQDYFPHIWKNPEQARSFVNNFVTKQGSNAALKARKMPTIADGRAAGLELADANPVRAASKYATSMNNYIASKRIATQIIDKGDAKYYTPGKQPEGWVPLTGRFAERTRSYLKDVPEENDVAATAIHEKLFAPPEVARIYNNFYSKGLEGTDLAKPYEIGRSLNGANTAAELALSAYHFGTITGQLLASDVSRVLKNTLVGDWKGVGKAVKSATLGQIPFLKGSSYKIGKSLIKQYKGLEDHGIDMESIAEHFERGGGKVGQEKLYRTTEKGGLFTGKGGIKQSVRDIKEEFAQPGMSPKAKATAEVFQRAMEDVSYPLFEKYIPSIKTGAFANLMGDWMRQNPGASDAAISAARKKYVDLVDDRFGEMNMDNVFWHKYIKQAASLFTRAQGWDIGLVRQAGGSVMDTAEIIKGLFKGKKPNAKLLDRPAFLASVIGTMALTSAAYQYMKTGKAPDEMLDYFAPKTGGTNTRGTAERTMLPTAAHGRELVHIAAPFASEGVFGTESPAQGLMDEVSNKVASLPRNVYQAYENEDFAGNKIAPTTGDNGWMGSVPGRVGHVTKGFAPFGLTGQGDKLEGSNLSTVERRLLGMRPAGMEISDPEDFKQMRWAQEMKKEVKSYKAEARREGNKE